jgi:DNA-binding NtrC family response regulator
MPSQSGAETFEQIRRARPAVKALLMGGYTPPESGPSFPVDADTDFIEKPFTLRDLSEKMQRLMGNQSS